MLRNECSESSGLCSVVQISVVYKGIWIQCTYVQCTENGLYFNSINILS